MVFKQVIGHRFSLENWPGFGINDVIPPVNHQGMSWGLFANKRPSVRYIIFPPKISDFVRPRSTPILLLRYNFPSWRVLKCNSIFSRFWSILLDCLFQYSQPWCRRVSTSFLFPKELPEITRFLNRMERSLFVFTFFQLFLVAAWSLTLRLTFDIFFQSHTSGIKLELPV